MAVFQLIISGFCRCLITITVPETYAPSVLTRRGKKTRKELNDSKYVTAIDLDERPFSQRLRMFLIPRFRLLFRKPIVMFLALYMSVLYGLLYMFFIAYPVVY